MGAHPFVSIHSDDWHTLLPDSSHVGFFRGCDWSKSKLGPLSGWTVEHRLYTLQAFADLRPVCLYLGPLRTAVYNAAFVLLAGGTHPRLMGAGFAEIYPEIVDYINPLFTSAEETRIASPVVNLSMLVERNGFPEEAIFEGSFIPLFGFDGTVLGFYNSVQEITKQKLLERRRKLCEIIVTPAKQLTSTTIYAHIAECLRTNGLDIQCACLYKVRAESQDDNHTLDTMGVYGIPAFKDPQPETFQLYDHTWCSGLLRSAQHDIVTEPVWESLGVLNWEDTERQISSKPPQKMTAIPLNSGGRLYGFVIVGNNPQRPWDEFYKEFMIDLQRACTSAVVASISMEEARERARQLQDRLGERERQIRYIAQHSDVGIMQYSLEGSLIWANEHYHHFMSGANTRNSRNAFFDSGTLLFEDNIKAKNAWQQVESEGKKVENLELRLTKQFRTPHDTYVPTTILLSASPYCGDSNVKSVMACMTDVSRLKWAESYQTQIANEAREARRRQAEFTDFISHEVRNPLSAVLQLADSIANPVDLQKEPSTKDIEARLTDNMDSARIILDCVQHQKRILDDVLILSRLDFDSVALTLAAVDPIEIVKEASDMVSPEASLKSISLKIAVSIDSDPNLSGPVSCDRLRVSQVLINLLSNALKFTKGENVRQIEVTYGVSRTEPFQALSSDTTWAVQQQQDVSDVYGSERSEDEVVFLAFTVKDTGSGMTQDQLKRVFNQFEQATPKTSIIYGGSGLGLYISQSLVSKQGGRIGVVSEPGLGTTFRFYIKAFKAAIESIKRPHQDDNQPEAINHQPLSGVQHTGHGTLGTTGTTAKTIPGKLKPKSNHHLLLVEDNLINQKLLSRQLSKAGCNVTTANHGLEALSILRTSSLWLENNGQGLRLDAILMDWEMPVMNGLDCTKEIRELERQGKLIRRTEIIGVTANVRAEQIEKGRAAGVDVVVSKPFKVSELLETVELRLSLDDKV